jgi:hypothetical protein
MTIRNLTNIALTIASLCFVSSHAHALPELLAGKCFNSGLHETFDITFDHEVSGSLRLEMSRFRKTAFGHPVYSENKSNYGRPNSNDFYKTVFRLMAYDSSDLAFRNIYFVFGSNNEIYVSYERPAGARDPIFRKGNVFICETYGIYDAWAQKRPL